MVITRSMKRKLQNATESVRKRVRKMSTVVQTSTAKRGTRKKKSSGGTTSKRKHSTSTKSKKKSQKTVDLWAKEKRLYAGKYQCVVGCDEAGRGPLAGPVVSAACHVPPGVNIAGINDSKTITQETKREEMYELLTTHKDIQWAATVLDRHVIDELNILQAAMKGMADSVDKLVDKGVPVDYVLVDGPHKPRTMRTDVECEPVVKGDSKCYSIAAASIIAKVTRDRIMNKYDKQYPQYKFLEHKGYPTPEHKRLVQKFGPCDIHRRSFNPVKTMLGWTRPKKTKETTATDKQSSNTPEESKLQEEQSDL